MNEPKRDRGLEELLVLNSKNQLSKVMETNQYTEQFGLTLTEEEGKLLVLERMNSLKTHQRIEFGTGILPKLIYEFCDSAYISRDNYVETITKLQNIFNLYKNEMMDEISDDELLHFMKEQFESVCYGDVEYLEGTCLNNFAQAVRAGYRNYRETDGYGQYEKMDEVQRWDKELYLEVLRDLCWR